MRNEYLKEDQYFDFNNQAVVDFARSHANSNGNPIDIAVNLYQSVRDEFIYNPYQFNFEPEQFKASHCVQQIESYCIPKAVLLGACARYFGIPARLGLADVKNHISSPRLLKLLGTDVFVMHGYIELYLNEQWVKATPAFDAALCKRVGIRPLPFNGRDNSVFQEYNLAGHKHMQYLKDHGTFQSVPVDYIYQSIKDAYPHLYRDDWQHAVDDSVFTQNINNK